MLRHTASPSLPCCLSWWLLCVCEPGATHKYLDHSIGKTIGSRSFLLSPFSCMSTLASLVPALEIHNCLGI